MYAKNESSVPFVAVAYKELLLRMQQMANLCS